MMVRVIQSDYSKTLLNTHNSAATLADFTLVASTCTVLHFYLSLMRGVAVRYGDRNIQLLHKLIIVDVGYDRGYLNLIPNPSFQTHRSTYRVENAKFELDQRYKVKRPVGEGAFGVIVSAQDMKTGDMVAIKKLRRVFDTPSISRRTIREVKLLRHLCHENIVSLVDITSYVNISHHQLFRKNIKVIF